MRHWIIATVTGIGLGLLLYFCVRLRMHFGPLLRERYGNWARWLCWFATLVVMIGLANAALLMQRLSLGADPPADNRLAFEIWFAVLALIVAMTLIFRRIYRGSEEND